MTRSRMIRWLLFVFLFSFPALSSFAETIELVTYYPAPGQGNDLHVNSLTVGPNYANQNPGPGVVLIENQLGIGTTAPAGALHVVGLAGGLDQVLFMPGVGGTLNVGIGMLNSPSLLGLGVDTGDPATRQAITVGNAGLGAPSPAFPTVIACRVAGSPVSTPSPSRDGEFNIPIPTFNVPPTPGMKRT